MPKDRKAKEAAQYQIRDDAASVPSPSYPFRGDKSVRGTDDRETPAA